MEQQGKLKIAICGAGISGMALAAFLAKSKSLAVDVFESNGEARMSGVGIAVWRRYWQLLDDELDFERSYVDLGHQAPDWTKVAGPTVRKSDGPAPCAEFCALRHGPVIVSRSTVSTILFDKINQGPCRVHFDKRLLSYDVAANGSVVLRFSDGSASACDLLVGADGVFSRIRPIMFRDKQDLALHRFSGQLAYRMSCPTTDLQPSHPALRGFTIWCGVGRHVTSNVLGSNVQLTAWDNLDRDAVSLQDTRVSDVPAESITDKYGSWGPDVVSLLQRVSQTATRWPIHVTADLPTYVSGRVALIGDAAHGMTPHQGLGAGQGIEDAFILAKLLSTAHKDPETLSRALAVFDQVRRPEAQRVARQSLLNGLAFSFLQPGCEDAALEQIGKELEQSCDWLLDAHGFKKDLARALGMMELGNVTPD